MNELSYFIGRIIGKLISPTAIVAFIFGLILKGRFLLNCIIITTAFIETYIQFEILNAYATTIPSSFFLALIVGLVVGNLTQIIRLSRRKKIKKVEKKVDETISEEVPPTKLGIKPLVENDFTKENRKKYEEKLQKENLENIQRLKDNAVDGLSGILERLGSVTKKTTKFIDEKINPIKQTTKKLDELEQLKKSNKISENEYKSIRKKLLDKIGE